MAHGKRLLPPAARKAVLTMHIVVAVGWIGVDAVLLALGARGLTTSDPATARAVYPVMAELGSWFVTPASLLALASGIILGAGTHWGLLRHWWVLASLVATAAMTAAANGLLVPGLHAAAAAPVAPEAEGGRTRIVVASSVALLLLCAVNALNVYKPRGRIRRFSRSAATQRDVVQEPSVSR